MNSERALYALKTMNMAKICNEIYLLVEKDKINVFRIFFLQFKGALPKRFKDI